MPKMWAAYEFAKELLVAAGFNDGRHFTIKEAREVVGPEFERRGYTRPYEKVAKELQFLALTEEDERRAYGHRRGGRVLTRVKKGVYTFTNPTPAPDDPAPAPTPLGNRGPPTICDDWEPEPKPEDHRRIQMTLRFTQLRDTLNQEMEADTLSSSKRLQQIAQLKEWMDACETIDV